MGMLRIDFNGFSAALRALFEEIVPWRREVAREREATVLDIEKAKAASGHAKADQERQRAAKMELENKEKELLLFEKVLRLLAQGAPVANKSRYLAKLSGPIRALIDSQLDIVDLGPGLPAKPLSKRRTAKQKPKAKAKVKKKK